MRRPYVLPARAGVILKKVSDVEDGQSSSRASGGDPGIVNFLRSMWEFFPRERG